MLETFAIPVLTKAADFLFEESSKILQERRERRKTLQSQSNSPSEIVQENPENARKIHDDKIVRTKDELLQQKVNEALWNTYEDQVVHELNLLELHTRTYYLARKQYAQWGDELVPPIILNRLQKAEDDIAATTHKLRSIMETITGTVVILDERDNLTS
jgi:hypothetical protein